MKTLESIGVTVGRLFTVALGIFIAASIVRLGWDITGTWRVVEWFNKR